MARVSILNNRKMDRKAAVEALFQQTNVAQHICAYLDLVDFLNVLSVYPMRAAVNKWYVIHRLPYVEIKLLRGDADRPASSLAWLNGRSLSSKEFRRLFTSVVDQCLTQVNICHRPTQLRLLTQLSPSGLLRRTSSLTQGGIGRRSPTRGALKDYELWQPAANVVLTIADKLRSRQVGFRSLIIGGPESNLLPEIDRLIDAISITLETFALLPDYFGRPTNLGSTHYAYPNVYRIPRSWVKASLRCANLHRLCIPEEIRTDEPTLGGAKRIARTALKSAAALSATVRTRRHSRLSEGDNSSQTDNFELVFLDQVYLDAFCVRALSSDFLENVRHARLTLIYDSPLYSSVQKSPMERLSGSLPTDGWFGRGAGKLIQTMIRRYAGLQAVTLHGMHSVDTFVEFLTATPSAQRQVAVGRDFLITIEIADGLQTQKLINTIDAILDRYGLPLRRVETTVLPAELQRIVAERKPPSTSRMRTGGEQRCRLVQLEARYDWWSSGRLFLAVAPVAAKTAASLDLPIDRPLLETWDVESARMRAIAKRI